MQRIEEAIQALGRGESLASASAESLMLAAEQLFARALHGGCAVRGSAVALLTVDALVTYAFERASDHPAELESRAESAMVRLAGLGARDAAPARRGT